MARFDLVVGNRARVQAPLAETLLFLPVRTQWPSAGALLLSSVGVQRWREHTEWQRRVGAPAESESIYGSPPGE